MCASHTCITHMHHTHASHTCITLMHHTHASHSCITLMHHSSPGATCNSYTLHQLHPASLHRAASYSTRSVQQRRRGTHEIRGSESLKQLWHLFWRMLQVACAPTPTHTPHKGMYQKSVRVKQRCVTNQVVLRASYPAATHAC